MDPHEFAHQQGQVIGSSPGQVDDEQPEVWDVMEMLLQAFHADGHMTEMPEDSRKAVAGFCEFGNTYLSEHRVVSTGIVDGEFSLVFQDGRAVPLASTGPASPERPGATVPITTPREHKMKGMKVIDNSVPVTTGIAGSPTRRSKG